MDVREFAEMLEEAVASRSVLSAMVHCSVEYSGRTETFLPRGDRILLVKSDRSLLVHQPTGSMPANYMRTGTEIAVERAGEHLVLRCRNGKEKAWMDIEVFRVHAANSERLEDGQKIQLDGDERTMSDYIRGNPSCISREFRPVSREEQTDVGFIDVFGHDGNGGLMVVECKRVTASLSAVDQLRRYVERVKEVRAAEHVTGVLAAPGITPNAKQMLESLGFRFCEVQPPKRLRKWRAGQASLAEY